jgi:hypothetical protein
MELLQFVDHDGGLLKLLDQLGKLLSPILCKPKCLGLPVKLLKIKQAGIILVICSEVGAVKRLSISALCSDRLDCHSKFAIGECTS